MYRSAEPIVVTEQDELRRASIQCDLPDVTPIRTP